MLHPAAAPESEREREREDVSRRDRERRKREREGREGGGDLGVVRSRFNYRGINNRSFAPSAELISSNLTIVGLIKRSRAELLGARGIGEGRGGTST